MLEVDLLENFVLLALNLLPTDRAGLSSNSGTTGREVTFRTACIPAELLSENAPDRGTSPCPASTTSSS